MRNNTVFQGLQGSGISHPVTLPDGKVVHRATVHLRPTPLPPFFYFEYGYKGDVLKYLEQRGAGAKMKAERALNLKKAEEYKKELGLSAEVVIVQEYHESEEWAQFSLRNVASYGLEERPGCEIEVIDENSVLVKKDGQPVELRQFLVCSVYNEASCLASGPSFI